MANKDRKGDILMNIKCEIMFFIPNLICFSKIYSISCSLDHFASKSELNSFMRIALSKKYFLNFYCNGSLKMSSPFPDHFSLRLTNHQDSVLESFQKCTMRLQIQKKNLYFASSGQERSKNSQVNIIDRSSHTFFWLEFQGNEGLALHHFLLLDYWSLFSSYQTHAEKDGSFRS